MSAEKLTLSLVDDELCLTNAQNQIVHVEKDFAYAMLNKDGSLSVTPASAKSPEEEQNYVSVVPNTTEMPIGCDNVVYFGLESQIMIVSLKNMKSFHHFETSTNEKVAKAFSQLVKNVPPRANQDVLLIMFQNGCSAVIYADQSDCLTFSDVLSKRSMRVLIDEGKNKVVLLDEKTNQSVDSPQLSVNDAKQIVANAQNMPNVTLPIRVYTRPLSFRTTTVSRD